MLTNVLGLCGEAGAGKDTVADYLYMSAGFERRAFADKLKEFAYALDPLVIRHGEIWNLSRLVDVFDWDEAKRIPDVRSLLQRLGTEAGRNVLGKNVWVDAVMRGLPERVVFTDCRFENEVEAIRDLGGKIVLIVRPDHERIATSGHASEQLAKKIVPDATIVNHGTLIDLNWATIQLLKTL